MLCYVIVYAFILNYYNLNYYTILQSSEPLYILACMYRGRYNIYIYIYIYIHIHMYVYTSLSLYIYRAIQYTAVRYKGGVQHTTDTTFRVSIQWFCVQYKTAQPL